MFLTKFEALPWQPTWEKLVDIFFLKLEPPASYNSMALSDLTISFVESFKIRSSDIHHENEMLDETRSKPIQHEKFVGWNRKCWMKNLLAIKFSSNTIFLHPTWFFLFLLFLLSVKPIQPFIQLGIFVNCYYKNTHT